MTTWAMYCTFLGSAFIQTTIVLGGDEWYEEKKVCWGIGSDGSAIEDVVLKGFPAEILFKQYLK